MTFTPEETEEFCRRWMAEYGEELTLEEAPSVMQHTLEAVYCLTKLVARLEPKAPPQQLTLL